MSRHQISEICECGAITGVACEARTDAGMVVVDHMPVQHRASHLDAGYTGIEDAGQYPGNGAFRLALNPACAERLIDAWTRCVSIWRNRAEVRS